jgi:hypothetical protein
MQQNITIPATVSTSSRTSPFLLKPISLDAALPIQRHASKNKEMRNSINLCT